VTERVERRARRAPRRIALVGSGGAGKSTLARRLGDATGLPVIHLDRLFWQPGWVPTPAEEWAATMAELVARPEWILDGHYGGTAHLRIDASDLVVLMDTPRWRCLGRVARRRLAHRGGSRPDMAHGCPEQLDATYVRWVWRFPRDKRPRFLEELHVVAERGHEAVRLRTRADADGLVADLTTRATTRT
jgi:adenylate kinase family enzyme